MTHLSHKETFWIKRAAEVRGRLTCNSLVHCGGLKSLNLLGRTVSLVSNNPHLSVHVHPAVPWLKDIKTIKEYNQIIKNSKIIQICVCSSVRKLFCFKACWKTLLLSLRKFNNLIYICKKIPRHGVSDSSSSSGDVGEVGMSSPSAAAVVAATVVVIFS